MRAGRSLELSGIARMLWGSGWYGKRVHALPQLALCIRDHGLQVPPELAEIAAFEADGAREWRFAQGHDRIAKLYHYKTRDYAMGSAAGYRWNEWGYQETVLHLRIGRDPDAQIWINHPGETIHSGYGRPSYWGGCGTLPRVHQYRALAVAVFDCADGQPDFTHAWFPQPAFDVVRVEDRHAFARGGDGLVMLSAGSAMQMVASGPTAANELRVAGRKAVWIVRLGSIARHRSLDEFGAAFGHLELRKEADGALRIDDPEYGEVLFHANGQAEAEGRMVDPAAWTITGEVETFPAG